MSPEDEVFSVKKGAIETYAQWKQEDPELYANYVARINATVKAADILDHSPTQGNFQTYEKLARPLNLEWQKERLLRKHAEIGKSLSTLLEERCEPIPDCGCGMWDGLADAELADAGEV